jgi:hypothetical protein
LYEQCSTRLRDGEAAARGGAEFFARMMARLRIAPVGCFDRKIR